MKTSDLLGQKITGYLPKDDGLKHALTGTNIVIIPAGIPRKTAVSIFQIIPNCGLAGKPGMTRDDLFKINAGIVKGLIEGVAQFSPKAFILVISNPVNSTVPIAAEVLKKAGVFDPKRLFGVTTLDVVRAETFVQEITGERDPSKTVIPVVGGHSGETIVPLFSQAKPTVNIPTDKLDALVNRKSSLRDYKLRLTLTQVFNLVVMKLSKQRMVPVLPLFPWRMLVSGSSSFLPALLY